MGRFGRFLAALLLAVLLAPWGGGQQPAYTVVVHASNPVSSLPRAEVSKIFLKKVTRWDDGDPIEPIDQVERSPTRAAFSEDVHRRGVSAIKSYWQRMIFSGREVPPPEVPDDARVLAFVRANPGAIGYVSANARPGSGVHELDVTE